MKKLRFTIMLLFFISLFTSVLAQQERTISGIVSGEGTTLPGVNVFIKGTETGTATDIDGLYSIAVKPGQTLTFSFVGYEVLEVLIREQKSLSVELTPSSSTLEEFVVVGYGTVKKSDLTGSVSSIKAEEVSRSSLTSLDQGLQGRAAGVIVTQTTGQPGASTSIRIRGTTSINGRNEPLYVIDGVPIISDPSVTSTGAVHGPSLNPLASLNPSDIESIEILKDASSTAIYGARGANGVVLISTKRGSVSESKITFDAYYGIQQVAKKMDMLSAADLAILGNEAADNANIARKIIYASPTNLGTGTDWQDEIFQLAPITNYQIGASGGADKTTYAISANYFDQQGVIINSDFSKITFRVNLDYQVRDNVKVGTSINYANSTSNGVVTDGETAISSSITSWALEMNPGLSVYDDLGAYVYENNTSRPATGNPVADALENEMLSTSNRIIGNIYAQIDLAKDIYFKTTFGTDKYFNKEQSFSPNYLKRAESSNGQAAIGNIDGNTWVWENTLNYNRIRDNHAWNVVVGQTMQAFNSDYMYVATSDFEDNRLGYYAIQAGADKTLTLSGNTGWQMMSYLGRINYNFKGKYLLTFTSRADGSSKFGVGNKYGFFPSFATGWRVSDEEFMANAEAISNLKLRASYGVVGNEGIPSYSSQGLLQITEAYFGENDIAIGAAPYTLANNSLQWETTAQFDIGFDLGLFDGRVDFTGDYYIKNTHNLLLNTPVPFTTGYTSAFMNIGDLKNTGGELAINAVILDSKMLRWNSSFNISLNRNKVLNLAGGEEGLVGQTLVGINGWTRISEGMPVGTIYGYETDGIIQLDENPEDVPYFITVSPSVGDRKYVDQDKNGILDEQDRIVLGNANPDFSFGWMNSVTYGNWDLTVYLQGVYGNDIVNFNLFSLESFDGSKNNSTAALDRWTIDNPSQEYPRADATPMSNILSNHQVEDGSYVRVKDLTLRYSFTKQALKKIKLNGLSVYVKGNNLYTLTGYSGYSPEVSRFANDNLSMGADYGSYPSARTIMIGVNLNL